MTRSCAAIPDALERIRRTLSWYKANVARWADEAAAFANFPTLYMGLVHENGNIGYSDGDLRVIDGTGKVLADHRDPKPYWEYLGESVEPWSYLKSTYWKDLGYPSGLYRVGPLARLNVIDQFGTAEADDELQHYRERLGRYPSSSFYYHHARLLEILDAITSIKENLSHPEILDDRVRAVAEPNRSEGVGVSEAPRGTLMHHYRVDANGSVEWANLVIATGHNNLAMNKGVLEVAREVRARDTDPRAHAQPGGSRHQVLRPLPQLLDARHRRDAPHLAAHRGGRTDPRRAG